MIERVIDANGGMPGFNVNDLKGLFVIDSIVARAAGDGLSRNDMMLAGAGDVISYNGGFTVSIGISTKISFPVFIFIPTLIALGFNVSPTGTISFSLDAGSLSMIDINGDGLPDHVLKYAVDDFFRVKINKAGMVGLLKTIQTPSGGTVELGYERTQNSVDMPNSQWVMNKVTHSDGMGASYATTHSYEDGYYDRDERAFYGFAKVTSTNADGTYVSKHYYNRWYYSKGISDESALYDVEGNLWQKTTHNFSFNPVDLVSPGNKPAFAPQLDQTLTTTYDVVSGSGITTGMVYDEYDRYGNILKAEDKGDIAKVEDDIAIRITYKKDADGYLVNLPETIEVLDGQSGAVLRKRKGTYDSQGNLKTHETYLKGGVSPLYRFDYDTYGNMTGMTDPSGYFVRYTYDSENNTYPVKVEDAFGYVSTAEYDFKTGLNTVQTDVNGRSITKTYDTFGRLTGINNPDAGLVEYKYDANGNLSEKIDPNLRETGLSIKYEYDFHRLKRVNYPHLHDVTYTYGAPGESFNRAGRMTSITDESGTKEFYYGILGQQEKVISTLNFYSPADTPVSFTTEMKYDYLGKTQWIKYPDTEEVFLRLQPGRSDLGSLWKT